MNWIWLGVLIVVLGTFVALVPALTPAAARARVAVPAPVGAVAEAEVNHA
jgi:cytochrome c-type biogenesis protein CcmF